MESKGRLDVNSIEIQHFRGISCNQKLDFSNKITILWGENGTGKSSFINALEYLFKKKLDALDFSADGKRDAFFHYGSDKKKFKIKLELEEGHYICRDINDVYYGDYEDFKKQHESFLDEASFILTRKKLLNFINVSDGKRYNALMDLCGLNKIQNIRNEINSTKNKYKNLFDAKKQEFERIQKKLIDILEIEDENDADFIKYINNNLKSINKELISPKTNLDEYLLNFDFSELYKMKKLDDLISNIDIKSVKEEFNNILINIEKINNDYLANLNYYFNLLNNSKSYLENTGDNKCPVCDSEIDNEKILKKITEELENVNSSLDDFHEWKIEVDKHLGTLNNLKTNINEINVLLQEVSFKKIININFIDNLKNDINQLVQFKITSLELKDKHDFNELSDEINNIKELINNDKSPLMDSEKYEIIKKVESAIKELNSFNRISVEYDVINSKFELVNKSLSSFDDAKEDLLKNIIDKISDNVLEYYQFIHGDDLIKSPRLNVKDSKSIEVKLYFFDKEYNPRLFSSEGHLDTLGLCIFLAFMREYNPLNFIVLDDIITTVDFSHKYQIARLIIEKFKDFKFLITTHNGLWAQQLEYISLKTKNSTCEQNRIVHWDNVYGPTIFKKKGFMERIENYLESDEPQVAVNAARQYLEFTMLEYCKNFAVKVRIEDHYTLSPLLNAVRKPSKQKAKKVESINIERFNELWNDLDKNFFIANKLSHYNDEAFFVHSYEIKQLCHIAIELCDMIHMIIRERPS